MKPTHCMLYCFTDTEHYPKDETSGKCLDYLDPKGKWKPCAEAIMNGKCTHKRKTPVL